MVSKMINGHKENVDYSDEKTGISEKMLLTMRYLTNRLIYGIGSCDIYLRSESRVGKGRRTGTFKE